MARTLGAIKTLVEGHTGRTKASLETALGDSALKVATMNHPFKDTHSTPSDFTITEDAYEVDISAVSPIHILTAQIVQADGTRNSWLKMKQQEWWDEFVVNPEDNIKCWPRYGLLRGSSIFLNGPAESGLELRLRISTIPTFADDDTECPIELLDIFVEYYMTAGVFMEMTNIEKAIFWKREALGPFYERGKVGGELLNAINADKFGRADELVMGGPKEIGDPGLAVRNLIDGHPRYGETHLWFK